MSAPDYSLVVQGSAEWKQLRCGNITASRAADVIATTKKGEGADRRNYRSEIICEILTKVPYPQYVTQEMLWGLEHEGYARAAYEMDRGVLVETCGFVMHPEIPRFGCSPDGLVDDDGMIQIKCPTTRTHLEWMSAGTVPIEHAPQMLAEMACTGRKWCDFVSFDCRLPEDLQLFVRRWERNDRLIANLESEVVHFNAEVDHAIAALPRKPKGVVIQMNQISDNEVQF